MTFNPDATSFEDLNADWPDVVNPQGRPVVLHLADPGSPGGGACTLHLLADLIRHLPSVDHHVMIVGTAAHVDLARRCGVPVSAWMAPPRALAFFGQRALQRYIDMARGQGVNINLVHAWSSRAAILASGAAPGGRVHFALPRFGCVATLHVAPMQRFPRSLHRFAARSMPGAFPSVMLASTGAVRRESRRAGFDWLPTELFPPAVDPEAQDLATRQRVRSRWSAEHEVTDDMFVVGLLGEPISWPDARAAATSVARAALSGRRVRLVLHHRTLRRVEADRFLNHLHIANLIILEDQMAEPWRIVAGLDAALVPGARPSRPAPSVLPALWALAAGVPTIVECGDAAHLIDDDVSGLVIDPHDVNSASLQIVRLIEDRELGRRLGEAARARVCEIYDMRSYAIRLRHTYDLLLAGRPTLSEA